MPTAYGASNAAPRHDVAEWNDEMYLRHATPYAGIAGLISRARLATMRRFAAVCAHERVLDLGCESGHLLNALPQAHCMVGADVSSVALKDAASLFRQRQRDAAFVQLDAQQPLPFRPGTFDVILSSEMLEHTADPRAVLGWIHEICDEHTRVVLSVPLEAPKLLVKRLLRSAGVFRLLFPDIEPELSEWHLQAFSRQMLLDMTKELFVVERSRVVLGMHYVVSLRKADPRLAGRP
jgi:SAM-dependent methyltransferase